MANPRHHKVDVALVSNTRPDWEDPEYAAKVVSHVSAKIEAARLQLEPCPHFVIHDLMPDDFYEIAQNFCASGTAYAYPIPNGNGEARFPATRAFKNSPNLTEEAHAFWSIFRDTVCATVNRAGSDKMRDQIEHYFRWLRRRGFIDRKAKGPTLVDSALQVFSRTISTVGSHHHSLYELLTNLVYMPADGQMADTGTWLDKLTDRLLVRSGRTFSFSLWPPSFITGSAAKLMTYNVLPSTLAVPVFQASYRPNTLLSILNTPYSLHSQRTQHRDQRHLLLFASLIDRAQWAPEFQDTRKGGFELYPDELSR